MLLIMNIEKHKLILKLNHLESMIKLEEWRVDFYSKAEQEYRSRAKAIGIWEPGMRELIRGAKKKRKNAQADLEYWWNEVKKVA